MIALCVCGRLSFDQHQWRSQDEQGMWALHGHIPASAVPPQRV